VFQTPGIQQIVDHIRRFQAAQETGVSLEKSLEHFSLLIDCFSLFVLYRLVICGAVDESFEQGKITTPFVAVYRLMCTTTNHRLLHANISLWHNEQQKSPRSRGDWRTG
jgi:hypothetical protein